MSNKKNLIKFVIIASLVLRILKRILSSKVVSNKQLVLSFLLVSLTSICLYKFDSITQLIMDPLFNRAGASRFRRRLGRSSGVSDDTVDSVMKRGGLIGGLVNDGNTCFMNSVLQSLASSETFVSLLQDSSLNEREFSCAFRNLLKKLNTKHYKHGHDYKTNALLKTMTKTPDKNFLLGYNQEDAQEFFQTLLSELEADLKKTKKPEEASTPSTPTTTSSSSSSDDDKAVYKSSLPQDAVLGNANIGHLGKVYVPAYQIDPNLKDANDKFVPYTLLTPVDGLSAERIGCLNCGEMGGIRYSVISGLSLNLPSDNYGALKLTDLLKEWIKPEIIEGVNCNRCALNHVLDYQREQLNKLASNGSSSTLLIAKLEERISQIEAELKKPIIDDDAIKKLFTENMMQKSSKSKQILMSRPPPLLAIHINRSVFDPMTYRVRKNNARVVFPLKLDLDEFVAEPDEINTDARLPMSKKAVAEAVNAEPVEEQKREQELEDQESDSDESDDTEKSIYSQQEYAEYQNPMSNDSLQGPLVYQLRSVIVHYGTHNYGHYIAYRRFRGVWWRTSDESIDVVSESEVLDAPGVFMMFYELDSLSEEVEDVDLTVDIPELQGDSNDEDDEDDEQDDGDEQDEDDEGSDTGALQANQRASDDNDNDNDNDDYNQEQQTSQAFAMANL